MKIERFEDIKNRLVMRINKLTPIMYRFIEVDSILRLIFSEFSGEDIRKESDWEEYGLFYWNRDKIIDEEKKGLKEGRVIVENAKFLHGINGRYEILGYLIDEVERHKENNNGDAFVRNFALDRVKETIERFPEPPHLDYRDYEWRRVKTDTGEIMVQGFTKAVLDYVEKEAESAIKLNNIGAVEKEQVKFSINFDFNSASQRSSMKRLKYFRYIFGKIETYVEAFFPGTVTFISKDTSRCMGRILTPNANFIFTEYDNFENARFVASLLNDKKEHRLETCIYFIYRMLHRLEGKSNKGKPGFTWCRNIDLQMLIPPDAKYVWNVSRTKILISRETETFIHITEEKDPFFKINVYPFQFFRNIVSKYNPLLKLKKERVKNVC